VSGKGLCGQERYLSSNQLHRVGHGKRRAGTCFWPGQKQESHHHITVSLFLWLPGRLLEAAEADLHAPQLKSLLMLLCIYPALETNTTNLNYKMEVSLF